MIVFPRESSFLTHSFTSMKRIRSSWTFQRTTFPVWRFGHSAIVDVTKMLSMSMFGRKVELSVAEAMKVYGIIGKVEDGLPCFPDSRYKKGHVFRSYLET